MEEHIRIEEWIRTHKPIARQRPCLFTGSGPTALKLMCTDPAKLREKTADAYAKGLAYVINTTPSLMTLPPKRKFQCENKRKREEAEAEEDEGEDIEHSEGEEGTEEEPEQEDLDFIDDSPQENDYRTPPQERKHRRRLKPRPPPRRVIIPESDSE